MVDKYSLVWLIHLSPFPVNFKLRCNNNNVLFFTCLMFEYRMMGGEVQNIFSDPLGRSRKTLGTPELAEVMHGQGRQREGWREGNKGKRG